MSFKRLEDYSFVKNPNSMFAIMYSFPLALVPIPSYLKEENSIEMSHDWEATT
jgi:hypothetical protein